MASKQKKVSLSQPAPEPITHRPPTRSLSTNPKSCLFSDAASPVPRARSQSQTRPHLAAPLRPLVPSSSTPSSPSGVVSKITKAKDKGPIEDPFFTKKPVKHRSSPGQKQAPKRGRTLPFAPSSPKSSSDWSGSSTLSPSSEEQPLFPPTTRATSKAASSTSGKNSGTPAKVLPRSTSLAAPAPSTRQTTEPKIVTSKDNDGNTRWTRQPSKRVYKCVQTCDFECATYNLLFQHFLESHCIDQIPNLIESATKSLGFDVCPDCAMVFKHDAVHKIKKCRVPVHSDPNLRQRIAENNRLFRERFVLHRFGKLEPGRDMPSPGDIFGSNAPILQYFPGGEELQADFRRIFIVITQCIKDEPSSQTQLANLWTLLFSLPRMLFAIPVGKGSDKTKDKHQSTAAVVQSRMTKFFSLELSDLYASFQDAVATASAFKGASETHPNNPDALVRNVVGLIRSRGELGKAGKRLYSNCLMADITKDDVRSQVSKLLILDQDYTPLHCVIEPNQACPKLLPSQVSSAVASMMSSAPGFSGWNKALFSALDRSEDGRKALTYVVNAIYSRSLPPELNDLITHCKLTVLQKPQGGVRPICAADCFIRLIAKCTVIIEQAHIAKRLEPLQVAVGTRGGAEIAIHGIRAHLDTNQQHIAVAVDLRNAFGSVHRSAISTALNLYTYESTAHSRWFFNHFGAPESKVALPNGDLLTYNRGVPQGGPTSMQWFCLALQPALDVAWELLQPRQGAVISYADDTFLIGSPTDVFKAFKAFTLKAADLGLQPRPDKCKILAPYMTLDQEAIQLAMECGLVSPPETAIIALGTPVGLPEQEALLALQLIDKQLFEKLASIDDLQCRLLLLRYCLATKYTHLARTLPPQQAWECLKAIDQLTSAALSYILATGPLSDTVLAKAALPIAMGGLSLKRLHLDADFIYYASASTALLHWRNCLNPAHPINQVHAATETRTSQALSNALAKCHAILDTLYSSQKDVIKKGGSNTEATLPDLPPLNLPKHLEHMMSSITPHPSKLQKALSLYSARNSFRILLKGTTTTTNVERIQIIDNSSGTTSYALLALPTEPQLQIDNLSLKLMLLVYLALPLEPALGLPSTPPINCACSKPDRPTLAAEHHLHNCNFNSQFLIRHTAIISVLNNAAKSVGLVTQLERPVHGSNGKAARRYDLAVFPIKEDSKIACIDLTIVSHATRDLVRRGNYNVALVAANDGYTSKMRRYQGGIEKNTEVFLPLAAQVNGGLHAEFKELFLNLGSRVNARPPLHSNWAASSFASYWLQRLSCMLWIQNARALTAVATKSLTCAGINSNPQVALEPEEEHALEMHVQDDYPEEDVLDLDSLL